MHILWESNIASYLTSDISRFLGTHCFSLLIAIFLKADMYYQTTTTIDRLAITNLPLILLSTFYKLETRTSKKYVLSSLFIVSLTAVML